jgi:lipid-A-disaccharide synthase
MSKKIIYIIAGEASGDILGAKLMRAIKIKNHNIDFFGIGGNAMKEEGLKSLFPIRELSIMGFFEIIPHIPAILKRIRQTIENIKLLSPNILITIDSPGFCFRVAKKIKNYKNIKLIHYVAPSVWAYKPGRAKKIAKIYDHLLALLPFEPPYFEKCGLKCEFIGHPLVEDSFKNNNEFRFKHKINPNNKLLCVMPGSRTGEIDKLLPIFADAIKILQQKMNNLTVVVISTNELATKIKNLLGENNLKVIITTTELGKREALAAANIALVKSGTSSLEVSLAKVPMVVAYKVNKLSAILLKLMLKVKFVSLVNIIENRLIIPEFLQEKCNADDLAKALENLLNDHQQRDLQLFHQYQALLKLGLNDNISPSEKAAKIILKYLD